MRGYDFRAHTYPTFKVTLTDELTVGVLMPTREQLDVLEQMRATFELYDSQPAAERMETYKSLMDMTSALLSSNAECVDINAADLDEAGIGLLTVIDFLTRYSEWIDEVLSQKK